VLLGDRRRRVVGHRLGAVAARTRPRWRRQQ
jgi:hypothetical protein